MKHDFALIGGNESMKIWIHEPFDINEKSFKTRTTFFKTSNDYYKIIPAENLYNISEVYPKKELSFFNKTNDTKDFDYIRIEHANILNGIRDTSYYTGKHINDNTFLINEKVRLWDNTIVGYNCIEWQDNDTKTLVDIKSKYSLLKKVK